ncbi:MAG: methyl-accepting chemotaxis protein [Candidatus Competibacter sp.]|nr:methyl-accepting chemotaxis protein [Candidatus Competibacter sp.]
MRFRTRLIALMAGMIALVSMLLGMGWWASNRLLDATDSAYQQGLKLTQTVDLARTAQVAFQRQVQEWKNVLIRGGNSELRERHWKGFETQEAAMDKALQALRSRLSGLGLNAPTSMVEQTLAEHGVLGQRYRAALQKQVTLNPTAQQAIDTEVRGMDRPTSAGIDTLVDDLQKLVAKRFDEESSQVRKSVSSQFFTAALVALILTAILVIAAIAMARSVLNALGADPEDAMVATSRIARGDLTERLNAKTPASLIGALEMMQSRLRNISLAIREVVKDIESRATLLPEGAGREAMLGDVGRLLGAIGRLRIDRDSEKSP